MSPFDFDVVTGPSGKRPAEPEPRDRDDVSAAPREAPEHARSR